MVKYFWFEQIIWRLAHTSQNKIFTFFSGDRADRRSNVFCCDRNLTWPAIVYRLNNGSGSMIKSQIEKKMMTSRRLETSFDIYNSQCLVGYNLFDVFYRENFKKVFIEKQVSSILNPLKQYLVMFYPTWRINLCVRNDFILFFRDEMVCWTCHVKMVIAWIWIQLANWQHDGLIGKLKCN